MCCVYARSQWDNRCLQVRVCMSILCFLLLFSHACNLRYAQHYAVSDYGGLVDSAGEVRHMEHTGSLGATPFLDMDVDADDGAGARQIRRYSRLFQEPLPEYAR